MPWWYSHTPDNSPRLADSVSNQMIRAWPVLQQNPEHRTDVPNDAGHRGAALLRLTDASRCTPDG